MRAVYPNHLDYRGFSYHPLNLYSDEPIVALLITSISHLSLVLQSFPIEIIGTRQLLILIRIRVTSKVTDDVGGTWFLASCPLVNHLSSP